MWKGYIIDINYGSVTGARLEHAKALIEKAGVDLTIGHYETAEEMIANLQDADILFCTGNPILTREIMEALPRLKVIQRFGIGYDSIDVEAATELGILVLYSPGCCAEELAVHATAFILNLFRNVSLHDRTMRTGVWCKAKGPKPAHPGDITLGLFGFGRSARRLWRIFHEGFGTKVIACDPYLTKEMIPEFDVELVSFEELLERSDVISIHAPLNKETRHTFGEEAFRKMKPEAAIINVARGALIDQQALIRALQDGEIRFAGLDVFEQEPLPADSPLRGMEQVVLTSHSAFTGINSERRSNEMVYELISEIIEHNSVDGSCLSDPTVISKIPGFTVR